MIMFNYSDVNSIADWMEEYHLKLHSGKCCAMLFTRKNTILYQYPLTLMGNQLNFVKQYKYLGLIFCPNFLWSSHVNSIINRARRLVSLLYRKFYEHLLCKKIGLWVMRKHSTELIFHPSDHLYRSCRLML